MYIDPIHAGPVALAHAFALAVRARRQGDESAGPESSGDTPRRRGFKPLMRFVRWWRQPHAADFPTPEPAQLVMWSECAGRPYVTALDGVLMMTHLHRNRAGARQSAPITHSCVTHQKTGN
jgi:hypothetical protein